MKDLHYEKIDYYVDAELEACGICERSGLFSVTTMDNNIKRSAEYILLLAEKIKNQRADLTMHLAGN